MTTASLLALVDAILSTATVVALIAGYRAIRRREIEQHRACMLAAFGSSAGFLAVFVYRFVTYGFHPFAGSDAGKVVYYILMFAHEPIAVLSVPMAVVTLVLGLRRARLHAEVARPTLVIWLIAALTGVVLYLFLYILPIS